MRNFFLKRDISRVYSEFSMLNMYARSELRELRNGKHETVFN